MIDTDDIRAAVTAGVLTERQAASLTALAHSRRGAREDLAVGDEPFELFRGFNEIFIMVGLLILAGGWAAVSGWAIFTSLETWKTTAAFYSVITGALVWALSEYFIRRRRMVGPAILLSILFAITAAFGLGQYFAQVFMLAREDYGSLVLPGLLTVAAILVYWLRFRVPFAMALMALGLFATALLAAATGSGTPTSLSEIFVLSAESNFAWITLALGIVTFCIAMMFDASDPHRVTRRASQGFWLHLVAAPMIINTVALSLLSAETETAPAIIIAIMVIFALVAIVIDRRSFLLAAIGYVVSVIFTLNPTLQSGNLGFLVLALGAFLVTLGAFWALIRAHLFRILPLSGLRRYLPPTEQIGIS